MTATKTTELRAPIEGVTEGHLVVHRGLGATTIAGDAEPTELVQGRWTGRRLPRTRVHRGTVELTFPRLALGLGSPSHEIRLNRAVPWRIEIDGGAGELQADLRGMTVHGVDVRGGVADSRIDLPTPRGSLVIRLGSVSDVTVTRPVGVPLRLRLHRGSRDVNLDGQSFGAIGGPATLATPGFETADQRIDLVVAAANHLAVVEAA